MNKYRVRNKITGEITEMDLIEFHKRSRDNYELLGRVENGVLVTDEPTKQNSNIRSQHQQVVKSTKRCSSC